MGGKSEIKIKSEGAQAEIYCFPTDNQTAKYSFGTKGDSFITTTSIWPKKTRDPGPGSYENKDVQFHKPSTKFSQAGRQSLAKKDGAPGPGKYSPDKSSKGKEYKFSEAPKLLNRTVEEAYNLPGPGSYATHEIQHPGQARSFLGGNKDASNELVDNKVPGPDAYF